MWVQLRELIEGCAVQYTHLQQHVGDRRRSSVNRFYEHRMGIVGIIEGTKAGEEPYARDKNGVMLRDE